MASWLAGFLLCLPAYLPGIYIQIKQTKQDFFRPFRFRTMNAVLLLRYPLTSCLNGWIEEKKGTPLLDGDIETEEWNQKTPLLMMTMMMMIPGMKSNPIDRGGRKQKPP